MRDEGERLLGLRAETAATRLRFHLARTSLLEAKRSKLPRSPRQRFAARLDAEIRANVGMLLSALGALDLKPADLPDVSIARAEALAEWQRRTDAVEAGGRDDPAHGAPALRVAEDDVARRFASRINAEQQQALGIDRYVWRSRDGALVRPLHAAHDDEIFFWDEPPEGGHPGEAFNCRCVAEPLLAEEPEWRPTIDASYGRAIGQAVLDGQFDGTIDFLPGPEDLWAFLDMLGDLAEAGERAAELAYLALKEQIGDLSDTERTRRDALLGDAVAWAEDLAASLAGVPELARALVAYVRAVEARPGALDRAHRQGLATRADVVEAYRERARLRMLVALHGLSGGLAARGLARHLLLRGGRRPDRGDDTAAGDLRELARRARTVSPHLDWPRIDNPGIVWGKGIEAQGLPWERYLAERGDLGDWIAERVPNFKTFDFYDPRTRVATSAKTLDTWAVSYRREPRRVFLTLKRYIDSINTFSLHAVNGVRIDPMEMEGRQFKLAVRADSTPGQIAEINRARAYAENLGIEMEVTFAK